MIFCKTEARVPRINVATLLIAHIYIIYVGLYLFNFYFILLLYIYISVCVCIYVYIYYTHKIKCGLTAISFYCPPLFVRCNSHLCLTILDTTLINLITTRSSTYIWFSFYFLEIFSE